MGPYVKNAYTVPGRRQDHCALTISLYGRMGVVSFPEQLVEDAS